MEETVIVIMEKDLATGFLEKEFSSFSLPEFDNLLVNIYCVKDESMKFKIFMKVSTEKDVLDWQFNAIFDYYDTEIFNDLDITIKEDSDCFNPTWDISFHCPNDIDLIEEIIVNILKKHNDELNSVYEAISHEKDAYIGE